MQHDRSTAPLDPTGKEVLKAALIDGMAQTDDAIRLTLEALADVDSAQVLTHQAVQAWAASLGTNAPLPLPQA